MLVDEVVAPFRSVDDAAIKRLQTHVSMYKQVRSGACVPADDFVALFRSVHDAAIDRLQANASKRKRRRVQSIHAF